MSISHSLIFGSWFCSEIHAKCSFFYCDIFNIFIIYAFVWIDGISPQKGSFSTSSLTSLGSSQKWQKVVGGVLQGTSQKWWQLLQPLKSQLLRNRKWGQDGGFFCQQEAIRERNWGVRKNTAQDCWGRRGGGKWKIGRCPRRKRRSWSSTYLFLFSLGFGHLLPRR